MDKMVAVYHGDYQNAAVFKTRIKVYTSSYIMVLSTQLRCELWVKKCILQLEHKRATLNPEICLLS